VDDGFVARSYTSRDGLDLHVKAYGASQTGRLPVVCLPGLTRNSRDFHELALFLSSGDAGRPVYAFDYRGRGLSAYDREWRNYNLAIEAQDVLDGMVALGIEKAAFIGTSRGGLIVHLLAAMRPTVLAAAVLNDIGPVIEGAGFAQIRAYLERAPQPSTLAEAIELQKSIHAPAFPALSEADWERMSRAIYRVDDGRPRADFDPNLVRTVTGVDLDRPLPDMWPQFEALRQIPVMVIRGANSRLLSADTMAEMQRRDPQVEAIEVPGQGHPPLLETGDLPAQIADFLDSAEKKTPSLG
jgi:pimeloyl-ACP methyl ester carboxylesterase